MRDGAVREQQHGERFHAYQAYHGNVQGNTALRGVYQTLDGITPERAAEFVKQCKDNGLREIFMVDSMLLSCANGEPNAKQVAFVTEFGDMLGFGQQADDGTMSKFAFLAILACRIRRGIRNFDDEKGGDARRSSLGYAKDFLSGLIKLKTALDYYANVIQ